MPTMINLEEYLTPKQVAEELGLKYPTFMKRVDKGQVVSTRFGRFHLIHRDEVNRLKEREMKVC